MLQTAKAAGVVGDYMSQYDALMDMDSVRQIPLFKGDQVGIGMALTCPSYSDFPSFQCIRFNKNIYEKGDG